jgi:hypothetical protein
MALNATIDLTVKKPDFKSMKSEIKELTIQAQQAVMQFGEFSPEASKAEKALAGARDRMEDFNDRVKAVNPDRFSKINTVVQGVASGFAAAQGAMALFGNESKDFEKTMIKLQGAMALSQGLEGLGKIQQQFGAIFKDVVSGAKKAFAAIKAGIGSTGIGLILVALGAIVAYWDDIKEAVSGVSEEQKKLLADAQKAEKLERDKLDTLNAQDNILKLQGLTEEEILQLKIKQTNAVITQLEAQLMAQETMKQAQIDAAQRNKDILQGVIMFLTAPLQILLYTIDSVGKALGKDFGLVQGFSGGLAKLVFDPKAVEEEANTAIAETKKQLNTLRNTVAGYTLSITDIHKKAADDRKKAREDADKEELEQLKKHQERLMDAIDLAYSIKRKKIYDSAEFEKKLTGQQVLLQEGQYKKEYSDREKFGLFIKTQHSELIDSTLGYFNTISELADAFATNDEASQKRAFQVNKAMRYASTVLSTIEGTQNAFTTAADSPITKVFPGYPFVQATAAALFGVAQLAKIRKTQFQSTSAPSGGGQMNGGGMPQMSAPNISSSLPSVSGFDTKVFVTEGDIRRTTDRVDTTRKVSVVK